MPDLNQYFTVAKDGGLQFTEAFYKLSLRAKKRVALQLEIEGLLENPRTLHRLGSALLQHSPKASQEEYPCSGIRTLSKQAREADNDELPSIIRAMVMDFPDGNVSLEWLIAAFEITEEDLHDSSHDG